MGVKLNQQYFINTKFVTSVFDVKALPKDTGKEIAFAGYSNCGKSSVINVVVQNNNLAITSKTPGRTQAINFFQLKNHSYLVDLPGYGYARAATDTKKIWANLIEKYLIARKSLVSIILIMDIRHPLKVLDQNMMLFCATHNLPVYILLNKADQLSKQQVNLTIKNVTLNMQEYYNNNIVIQPFSALKKYGVQQLQDHIISCLK